MPGECRLALRACVAGASAERPRLDVELEIGAGITVVMGPSGAGKTTLLATIAGLLLPNSGDLLLDGRVLFDSRRRIFVPPHRRKIALVFQSLALFPHLRVWENVAYGVLHVPKHQRREVALNWLTRARVEHLANRQPATLSGGEAQRVALARALASDPQLLLLDEPFSAMDRGLHHELRAELGALLEQTQLPTIVVSHDQQDAVQLGARVLTLDAGRLHDAPIASPSSRHSAMRLAPQF